MPSIVIRGTVINFPDSGASPQWSPAIIQFAQQVEDALRLAVGTFDVSPQTFNIDSYNSSSNIDIPNLSFDVNEVQGAIINVTTLREDTSPTVSPAIKSEISELLITYNADNSIGSKWEIARKKTGDSSIEFSITDTGQVQFTTTSIGTGTHTGMLSYMAKTLTNS